MTHQGFFHLGAIIVFDNAVTGEELGSFNFHGKNCRSLLIKKAMDAERTRGLDKDNIPIFFANVK